jgi:hypothetical protein
MRPIRFGKKTSDSPTGAAFELGLHQSVVPERAEKQSGTRAQRGQLGTFRLIDRSAMLVDVDAIFDHNVFQRITRLRDLGRLGRPLWPGLRRRPESARAFCYTISISCGVWVWVWEWGWALGGRCGLFDLVPVPVDRGTRGSQHRLPLSALVSWGVCMSVGRDGLAGTGTTGRYPRRGWMEVGRRGMASG